jgi:hypothetical protein
MLSDLMSEARNVPPIGYAIGLSVLAIPRILARIPEIIRARAERAAILQFAKATDWSDPRSSQRLVELIATMRASPTLAPRPTPASRNRRSPNIRSRTASNMTQDERD